MKEVREQERCFLAKVVTRNITGAVSNLGLNIEISFIGALGLAPPAEYVRFAVGLEIQINLCSAKGVMAHTIVTVSNHHTRMLAAVLICALSIQSVTAVIQLYLEMD
jgi:hypothetical protein